MTTMMRKCRRFGCDRGVTHLRWALGYRSCGRHGSEAPEKASGTVGGAIPLLGVSDFIAVRAAGSDESSSHSPVGAIRESSRAA